MSLMPMMDGLSDIYPRITLVTLPVGLPAALMSSSFSSR